MSFSINLDQTDVVNKLFGVVREEEGIEPDRDDLITTAGVGSDATVASIGIWKYDKGTLPFSFFLSTKILPV